MRAARRVRRGDRGKRTVVTPEPRPRSYPMFLLITRVAAWLRLSRREEAWKTDGNPIAAASFARPGPTTPSLISPRRGSSAGPSSAASSTTTSEPHRSPGQHR